MPKVLGIVVLVTMTLAVAPVHADECSGILCRQEIEGSDGIVVKLARILEDPSVRVATTNTTAFSISFWEPGPSAVDLKAWHDAECSTCTAPAGYDEVDKTVDQLKQAVDLSKSLKAQPIDDVAKTWQSWITMWIDKDPKETDDFDDTLRIIAQGDPGNPTADPPMPPIKGINGWRTELIKIRDTQVPPCSITSASGAEVTIDNSPCTINQPRKEEFNREIANTRDFLTQLTDPKSKFYHDLIINRVLLPELPGRLSVYLVGADKIRNLEATIDTIDLIDGVLTYTFTSTFEFFDDYAARDWVKGQNQGKGTLTITSLELGGSPTTNGLITYTYVWSFISYDVPKPVPTIVPGPVIAQVQGGRKIVSWTSVKWTWMTEQADFSAGTFRHHLEMPKPYTCEYTLEDRCAASACPSGGVCIGLGDCSAVKDQATPPGVTNPPGLSDTIPVIRLVDPAVDVSCANPPVKEVSGWGCPDPGSPFLTDPSVGCTLVNPHRQDIDQMAGRDGPGYSCSYSQQGCAHCSGWPFQPGDDFYEDLGTCLSSGLPSGSVTVPVPSGSPPSRVSVYCDTFGSPFSSCGDYLQCYTQQQAPCVLLTASGTYRIDDDKPTGTGLTISPPRAVNAPKTVQSFADGVDAFDAFVNGIQTNASCSKANEICFGSSNADTADEFWPVLDALATFAQSIETFRTQMSAFSDEMWRKFGQFGGTNPVTYSWRASHGGVQDNHSVTVEVSNFKLSQIKKKKKGNWLVGKICMQLRDYTDDGANTWVTIKQRDPSATIGGTSALWTWNPFGGTVCKQACASYSFNRVGLVDCPVNHCP